MSDENSSTQGNCAPWPFAFATFPEAARLHHHVWVDGQAALVEEIGKMSAAWVRRRQDGIVTSLQAIEALWGCKDAGVAAAVVGTWSTHMITLAAADIVDIGGEATRVILRGQHNLKELSTRAAEIVQEGQ